MPRNRAKAPSPAATRSALTGLRAHRRWRRGEAPGAGRRDGRAALTPSSSSARLSRRRRPARRRSSGSAATARRSRRTTTLTFVKQQLDEKLPEWEANGIVPTEAIADPDELRTRPSDVRDDALARPLLTPAAALPRRRRRDVSRACSHDVERSTTLDAEVAFALPGVALDTMLNYRLERALDIVTSRGHGQSSTDMISRCKWSYAEMAPLDRRTRLRLGDRADCEVHRGTDRADAPRSCGCSRADSAQGLQFDDVADSRAAAGHDHLPVRRQPDAHRRRERGLRRDGPAVLRQRDVRGAVRLLLRLAQAHGGPRVSRNCSGGSSPTRTTRPSPTPRSSTARRARRRWPRATTSSAWPGSSPSAAAS